MLLNVLNFTNIRILAGGYTHWLEDGQTIELRSPKKTKQISEDSSEVGLKVLPQVHDFGLIRKEDGIVSTTFMVQNTSAAEISTTEITTSCGCTTAEIDSELIPPGESRTLLVHFDPNFHKEPDGKFSRTVFLQTTNDKEVQAKIEVEIAK